MQATRLTAAEIDAIIAAAQTVFGDTVARIRLYGSRVDLAKKGGDIDLVVEISGEPIDKFARLQQLRRELCDLLGEQKFDLLIIADRAAANSDRERSFF